MDRAGIVKITELFGQFEFVVWGSILLLSMFDDVRCLLRFEDRGLLLILKLSPDVELEVCWCDVWLRFSVSLPSTVGK